MNIVEFIEARLTEDEAWARNRIESDAKHEVMLIPPRYGYPEPRPARPNDPARVVRQRKALREWLDRSKPFHECRGHPGPWLPHGDYGPGYCHQPDPSDDLCVLAAIWSDHPDYNEAWA